MKKFKIYAFSNNNPILITDSERITAAATFDEKISLQENMYASMSFKISDKIHSEENKFVKFIYPGAKIRFVLSEINKTIDFIITNISSEFSKDIIIYNVSGNDYASTIYSKEGQGLSVSYTGTLRELTYEILVSSRKNIGYTNLNKNFLDFNLRYEVNSDALVTENSFYQTSATPFETFITFNRTRDLVLYDYYLSFNVLNAPTSGMKIRVSQYDANNTFIQTDFFKDQVDEEIVFNEGQVSLFFTPRNSMNYYRVEFITLSEGTLSIVDWALKLDINQFSSIINSSLKLSDSFNEEDFRGEVGDLSYFKKVTLEIENSNLYNALIELGKLFDGEVLFDYQNNEFNFINKEKYYRFRGIRLSPEFNVLSLSREEKYDEFLSVMNIKGSEDVYSIYPDMPSEFKQFFNDQIDNNFADFDDYNLISYVDLIDRETGPKVIDYIAASDNYEERIQMITDFAKAADKVPNLENTLYSLDYFKDTEKITNEKYDLFNNIVVNELRKVNIKFRIYTDLYLNAASQLSAKQSEIDFVSKNITVELINRRNIAEKLVQQEINSNLWLTYQNQYDLTFDRVNSYSEELMRAYNIDFDIITLEPQSLELISEGSGFKLSEDSYASLMLNVYGYYNVYKNGITQKVEEIRETIRRLRDEKELYQNRVDQLNELLEDITLTSYRKREFEVEKSGLEFRIKALIFLIGEYTTDVFNPSIPGQYQTQLYYLEKINDFLNSYTYRDTNISYSNWTKDTILQFPWNYTGAVLVAEEPNKDSIGDLMARINTASSATVQTTTPLEVGKQYRASGTIKIPANTAGIINISINSNNTPTMALNISSVAETRWLVYEFYINSLEESRVYNFPSFIEIPANFTDGIIDTTGNYTMTHSFTATAGTQIFLYRPRLEEVTDLMPTAEDLYELYDNPLMINYTESINLNFDYIEGLYDLLYNYNYPNNVAKEKNLIISGLYKDYEQYVIEGYYENSEELDSTGLMDQALLAFETIKYPRIDYGVSIIDLSDIENYEFMAIDVGDKVLISELEDRLYKSYQPESTKYLQISEISYDLRRPEGTSITVRQDDETTKILQYILKATQ